MKKKLLVFNNRAFTLVELVVASGIILLTILVLAAMLRKGREIDINDKYRRKARAIVVSKFDEPAFHYSRYNSLNSGTQTTTDTIDAAIPILGTVTTAIGDQATHTAANAYALQYRPVTIRVVWTTMDGADSVSLTKYITRAE